MTHLLAYFVTALGLKLSQLNHNELVNEEHRSAEYIKVDRF